ncbi:MAG: hypothetical protein ACREEM_10440 [Blastocatellia bacterium]
MLTEIGRLWRGELPLARAFWGYCLAYGLAVNLLLSGLSLVSYLISGSAIPMLVLHFAPLPYNVVACAGAWKSANRYSGPLWHGLFAKASVVGLFVALLII